MGETPKITDPVEALAAARASFEDGDDFTVGVEEEFAILDRERLNMTAGFERFDAAARTGPLAGMVAGELIRSEVEVRTGRCESFPEAAETMARRRIDLLDVADRIGYRLSATGTHPFALWQDQEVIDTPHYHLVESTLRYVAWRNNTFGIHVHTGIRGADRAIAVNNALRSVLPELLAASCSSPWLEGRTRTCSRPAPRSSPASSPAAASPTPSTGGPSTTASCGS
jgi:carboxylate-amine ligase